MANTNKARNLFQIILLGIMLIGLPAGSWYYLNSGLKYRQQAMSELGDYGKLPQMAFSTYNDEQLDFEDLQGKFIIANTLPEGAPELRNRIGKSLAKLHEQFDQRNDLLFLTFNLAKGEASKEIERVGAFVEEHELRDEEQNFFLIQDSVQNLLTNLQEIPFPEGTDYKHNPYFMLADSNQTILQFYDVTDDNAMGRMVEHIALILPRTPDKDIIFKRETEK